MKPEWQTLEPDPLVHRKTKVHKAVIAQNLELTEGVLEDLRDSERWRTDVKQDLMDALEDQVDHLLNNLPEA